MAKVTIYADLSLIPTTNLIDELLERSETSEVNAIDELAFHYFLKKLNPTKVKKVIEKIEKS